MAQVAYRMSTKSITLMLNNQPAIIPSSHINFDEIKSELMKDVHDEDRIADLTDLIKAIKIASAGRVEVYNSKVLFDGVECHNFLATRILQHAHNKLPFEPLMLMLTNLMDNPNTEIRNDLFAWLEAGDMPVTSDGHIIGYKYVQDDYYSAYMGTNGKVFHGLYETVSMPRGECDEDRKRTCSTGLHFCSFGYLGSYSKNNRIIIVKVNPKNITAIPDEYNLQKARCCEYYVMGEITEDVADHYRGTNITTPEGNTSEFTLNEVEDVDGVEEETFYANTGEGWDEGFVSPSGYKSLATPAGVDAYKDEKADAKAHNAKVKAALKGKSFTTRQGVKIKAYTLFKSVGLYGQRGASKKLGIPRTTIQSWLLSIQNETK